MPKQVFSLLLFVIFGRNISGVKEPGRMQGVYNLLSESFKGISFDTTYTNRTQFKIYADNYMMYLRINKATGVSAMGIGTYKFDSGKLKENIFYSTAGDMEIPGAAADSANITRKNNGYKLEMPNIMSDKGLLSIIEEYESVGKPATSVLDGAWKNTAFYSIKGTDTTKLKDKIYKIFFAGYWASGIFRIDSMMHPNTEIMYGPFEMEDSTKIKETVITATSEAFRGQTFDAEIEMQGADEFVQM
ncbi:MAG TPA: hypothetical protein PLA68_13790, partial [Panacibacter sp.]|nr:hypothetical protein [Panacibacter sp.]